MNSNPQPHSPEAEEAVIGSILIAPEIYTDLARDLRTEHFYSHRLRWVWDAFGRLAEKGEPADIITVSEEMHRHGQLDEIGGPAFLTALINQVPTILNAETYAKTVRNFYVRRSLLGAANQIAALALDEAVDVPQVVVRAEAEIQQIVRTGSPKQNAVPIANYIGRDKEKTVVFEPTPWAGVNRHLRDGGWASGELNLLAARPGDGKTAMMIDMAVFLGVQHARRVAIYSLEMRSETLANRMLAYMTGIDSKLIDRGRVPEEQLATYNAAIAKLSQSNIVVDDDPDLTPNEFLARVRAMKRDGGVDIIFLDYLQLMLPDNRNDSREQQVAYASRTMKRGARELDVPVVALAQLNRSAEQRVSGEPQLSDLRESGALEQDADTVTFLWQRADPGRLEGMPARVVMSKLAKNRNGSVGTTPMLHRPDTHKFVEATTNTQTPR